MGYRWRRRRGRPRKLPRISYPYPEIFYPGPQPVLLTFSELEALRLVDYEDMTQEEAAQRMGVSRATVWRLVKSGRKKLVMAVLQGRGIRVVPDEVMDGGAREVP